MSAAIVDNEREVGSKYIKSGTISVQGGLRTAEYEEVESQLELSSAKEEFMNGVLDIIIGHAESWLSDVAKSILDSLQQKGKIVFSFADEAHIPLAKHWNSFRPYLKRVLGMLRGRAIRGSLFLATTATLTVSSQSISGEIGLIHCMYEIEHVKYVEEGLLIRLNPNVYVDGYVVEEKVDIEFPNRGGCWSKT